MSCATTGIGRHGAGALTRENRRAQNLPTVVDIVRETAGRVAEAVSADEATLVLGGDCTVGIGIPVDEVAAGPERAARRGRELIEDRCDRLLVHFDVDVIDFTDVPLGELGPQ